MSSMLRLCSLLFTLLLFTSCSLFTRKGNWGKKAIYPVKWERVKNSFVKNITSRHVWVPAAAGTVVAAADWDAKMVEWAERDPTISSNSAQDFSDTSRSILQAQMYLTIPFTSSYDGNWKHYTVNKVKGTVVVYASSSIAHSASGVMKQHIYRLRPDEVDGKSFPSGHATTAAAYRMISSRNYNSIEMPRDLRNGIGIINGALVTSVAWSRVEAKDHFPSDVLFGYAIGSFMSGFIYDSFMNVEDTDVFALFPSGDGGMVAKYSFQF